MERAGSDAVAQMVELCTDMMLRYLSDRAELSPSATMVMNRVNREGPLRLTSLADAEGASQSGMTQLVQRMERQGLLERWSDPDDGRASLVKLAETGRQFWEARSVSRQERVAELLRAVSEDDQTALWLAAHVVTQVLGRVRDAADTASIDRT